MIVTREDFHLVPYNLVGLPSDDNSSDTTFQDYINEQEEVYLRKLLGNSFYDLMIAAFAAFPDEYDATEEYATDDEVRSGIKVYKSLVDANMGNALTDVGVWQEQVVADNVLRWLKLFVGETYLYSNRSYKWWGMVQMVKPLIYALWIQDYASTISTAGRTSPATENGTDVDSRNQHCKGWNRYQLLACGEPSRDYYYWHNYSGGCTTFINSLFGYLYVNADSFADLSLPGYSDLAAYLVCEFHDPKTKNIYDI